MLRLIQLMTAILVLASVIYRFLPAADHVSPSSYPKTEISELISRSREYDGKAVTVTGTVTGNAGVFGYGAYRLRRAKDELLIISRHGIPESGTEVTVSGTFRQAFAINSYIYSVVVEK